MPLILLVPHDAPQPEPDKLSTLTINHLWRRHVAAALTAYFERAIGNDLSIPGVGETMNLFRQLLIDLYDSEIGLQAMRIATIHLDTTVVYPASQSTRVQWDETLGPFYYDPDGMFNTALNTFAAQEPGVYALLAHLDENTDIRDYQISVRKVGETENYSSTQVQAVSGLNSVGQVIALFRGVPGETFEVILSAAGQPVAPDYGYAVFLLLGNL